jgi:hypothetical protein
MSIRDLFNAIVDYQFDFSGVGRWIDSLTPPPGTPVSHHVASAPPVPVTLGDFYQVGLLALAFVGCMLCLWGAPKVIGILSNHLLQIRQ